MDVLPFLAACHTCVLMFCCIVTTVWYSCSFEWQIKFSLSLSLSLSLLLYPRPMSCEFGTGSPLSPSLPFPYFPLSSLPPPSFPFFLLLLLFPPVLPPLLSLKSRTHCYHFCFMQTYSKILRKLHHSAGCDKKGTGHCVLCNVNVDSLSLL